LQFAQQLIELCCVGIRVYLEAGEAKARCQCCIAEKYLACGFHVD